jgi:polysaccharide pyruvyl transferase CsaB
MADSKIFISGYYGFDNAGDEAILAVMLEHLRELTPGAQFTVLSGNPAETAAAHGVQTVLWSDPLAIAEGVRQADLVLVGGGGLFHDYTGFIPDALLTEGNWGLGYHVTAALLAALFGKPLMLYAVGVGPLFSEHGRRFTRAACEAASAVTVRDEGSKQLLESIGVASEKIMVTADPAFALAPAPRERVREMAAGNFPGARPLVGVVVRHWAFGVHPAFWEKEVAGALDLFLENSEGGVLLIPFQQIPGVQENDPSVAARVHAQMKQQARAVVARGPYQPAELAALLGACDLVVGMRLHSAIFSMVNRVPFVAVDYDPKVRWILREAGLDDNTLDIGELEAPLLCERMKGALAGSDEYRLRLEPILTHLREQARLNAEVAVRIMTDGVQPSITPEVIGLLRAALVAQLRESDDLRRRLTTESAEKRVLEQSVVELRVAAGGWESASQDGAARAAEAERRAAEAERCTAEAERRAAEQEQRIAELETAMAAAAENLDAAARSVAAAEESYRLESARSQSLQGQFEAASKACARERQRLHTLQASWDKDLGVYRGQRAWTAMLVMRKAYTLVLRRGAAGWLQFLLWAPGLLLGRTGDLKEYDLVFPRLKDAAEDEGQ